MPSTEDKKNETVDFSKTSKFGIRMMSARLFVLKPAKSHELLQSWLEWTIANGDEEGKRKAGGLLKAHEALAMKGVPALSMKIDYDDGLLVEGVLDAADRLLNAAETNEQLLLVAKPLMKAQILPKRQISGLLEAAKAAGGAAQVIAFAKGLAKHGYCGVERLSEIVIQATTDEMIEAQKVADANRPATTPIPAPERV